jgi:cytochrome c biogenesis protein CcmG/thiol:disulfide interchange protein DsbE
MRRLAYALAAVALLGVLVLGITQAGSGTDKTPPFDLAKAQRQLAGSPAPLAALHRDAATLQEGGNVKKYDAMLARLKGYPVVVNLWGTWCGPCKLEFPLFQQVATRFGKRVAFVGVNVTDNNDEARKYLAKRPVPYPSLEDGDARIAQHVGFLGGLPVTVFYDRRGHKFVHQGGYEKIAKLERDIRRYAGA